MPSFNPDPIQLPPGHIEQLRLVRLESRAELIVTITDDCPPRWINHA